MTRAEDPMNLNGRPTAADFNDPDPNANPTVAGLNDSNPNTNRMIADLNDSDLNAHRTAADPTDPNTYFTIKMDLLKQILKINEEFLSSLDNWESYETHLSKRETIIHKLQELDESFGKDVIRRCSDSQKSEMDRMLNLILALDKDIAAAIDEDRRQTLASMKATIKEKKITGYGNPVNQSGKLLDRKR
jgi:hypothetical protein